MKLTKEFDFYTPIFDQIAEPVITLKDIYPGKPKRNKIKCNKKYLK